MGGVGPEGVEMSTGAWVAWGVFTLGYCVFLAVAQGAVSRVIGKLMRISITRCEMDVEREVVE